MKLLDRREIFAGECIDIPASALERGENVTGEIGL
jgi:hypothetical protein